MKEKLSFWNNNIGYLNNDSFPVPYDLKNVFDVLGLEEGKCVLFPCFGGGEWLFSITEALNPEKIVGVDFSNKIRLFKMKISSPSFFLCSIVPEHISTYYNLPTEERTYLTLKNNLDTKNMVRFSAEMLFPLLTCDHKLLEKVIEKYWDELYTNGYKDIMDELQKLEKDAETMKKRVYTMRAEASNLPFRNKFDYCFLYEVNSPFVLEPGEFSYESLLKVSEKLVIVPYHPEEKLTQHYKVRMDSSEKLCRYLEELGCNVENYELEVKCFYTSHRKNFVTEFPFQKDRFEFIIVEK